MNTARTAPFWQWTARTTIVLLVATFLVVESVLGGASAAPPEASFTVRPLGDWRAVPAAGQSAATAAANDPDGPAWMQAAPLEAGDAVMVGLTHPSGEALEAEVRTRSHGQWSDWSPVPHADDDHGPDPGTEEAAGARTSTEPVWIGEVDKVQIRTRGQAAPSAVELQAVEVDGSTEFDPRGDVRGAAHAAGETPDIVPRESWDPDDDCRPRDAPSVADEVEMGVVHHTVNANDYSPAEAATMVRSICLYHRNGRGWDDIGYNFLVDRYGTIYEGRAGGMLRPVIGAHASGYNSGSFGVSVLGCFNSTGCSGDSAPTKAAVDAVDRLVGWKFALHGIDPHGTVSYDNGSEIEQLPTIFGHGYPDRTNTSCPGNRLDNYVTGRHPMRDRVASLLPRFPAPWVGSEAGHHARNRRGDLSTFGPVSGRQVVARYTATGFTEQAWERWSTRRGWEAEHVGDFTGDGRDDRVAFHRDTGNWIVTRSYGDRFEHFVASRFRTTDGWNTHLVGDFSGDGKDDIASFHRDTGNWVVQVAVAGGFEYSVWGQAKTTSGWTHRVGDFDGDGRDDIASYHPSTGNWIVRTSTGERFRQERWETVQTRTGWKTHLVGDFDGDGRDDLARWHDGSRNWVVSRSLGTRFENTVWGKAVTRNGWTAHLAGDLDGDGRDDVVSYNADSGRLWIERSRPDAQFAGEPWAALPGSPASWGLHRVIDHDGDGREDVASYRIDEDRWWVTRSNGATVHTTS